MPRYSSSDSDYSRSSSKRKKKSSRKRRSRSSSYDSSRRKHGKSKKKRSRSRSGSSDRSSSSFRRRRSRSQSRDNTRQYDSKYRDAPSSRKRRSRDRSKSPIRRKKHVDAVMGVSTGTLKDVMDIVPGFSKMTPAEQSRIRVQRALNAAVESSKEQRNEDEDNMSTKEEEQTFKEQIERAKAIQMIDDEDEDDDADFLPSHFRSSAKTKKLAEKSNESAKKTFTERESTHEIAIFGHASMLSLDQALKRKQETDEEALYKARRITDFTQRDPRTLAAPALLITPEEAASRWRSKLLSLHHRFEKDLQTIR